MDDNWSSLPKELLDLILKRLALVDQFRFAAVNKHWSSAAAANLHPPAPQLPWIWLTPPNHSVHPGSGQFYSPEEKRVYNLTMPEEALAGFCCGSHDEWLIHTDDSITELYLTNPLLPTYHKMTIQLPSDIVEYPNYYTPKVVLSTSPTDPDCIIGVLHDILGLFVTRGLIIEDWEYLEVGRAVNGCSDIISYNGSMYAASNEGELFLLENNSDPPIFSNGGVLLQPPLDVRLFRCYQGCWRLVGFTGDLLMVYFVDDNAADTPIAVRQVFKANLSVGKWEKLRSLGSHTLLIGKTGSKSMLAGDLPCFRKNCVYFLRGHCVHMLDLAKKKVQKNVDRSHDLITCHGIFWSPSLGKKKEQIYL